jgi:hypothetical protein
MKTLFIVLSLAFVVSVLGPLYANDYYVSDKLGDDSWDGKSPIPIGPGQGPKKSISAGISVAGTGDTVWVAAATYKGVLNKDLDFEGKGLVVIAEMDTVIDCEGSGRGFYFHSGEISLYGIYGFTIKNGGGVDFGGGIACDNASSPTIRNCTILDCSAAVEGGGIDCYWNSDPVITACTIRGCTAGENGGGINCFYYSDAEITDCDIDSNAGGLSGGGIHVRDCDPTITDCNISHNACTTMSLYSNGGGIACLDSSPTISGCRILANDGIAYGGGVTCGDNTTMSDCLVSGNEAIFGGGIFCDHNTTVENCQITGNSAVSGSGGGIKSGGNVKVTCCLISGNSAYGGGGLLCSGSEVISNCVISENATTTTGHGGGISCTSDAPTVINCTITGNSAGVYGGGISSTLGGALNVTNCIIYYNAAPNGHEIAVLSATDPSTLTIGYSDVQGGSAEAYVESGCTLSYGPGNINVDPHFVNPARDDYHLFWDSLCIDVGDDFAPDLPLTDRDGYPRIMFGRLAKRVDMGAYEFGLYVTFTDMERVANSTDIELTWLSSGLDGTTYNLYYSDDEMSSSMTWILLKPDIPTGGILTSYIVADPPGVTRRFFRVGYSP